MIDYHEYDRIDVPQYKWELQEKYFQNQLQQLLPQTS